jgi:hypothetical protein
MSTAPHRREERSIADLLRELRDESVMLFRQEITLAKTEMSEKVSRVSRNAAYIAMGGGIVGAGALFVLLAVTAGLYLIMIAAGASPGLSLWLSPLIVGVVVALVGYIFIKKGQHTIKNEPVTPEKTVQSLKEDKEWTESKLR